MKKIYLSVLVVLALGAGMIAGSGTAHAAPPDVQVALFVEGDVFRVSDGAVDPVRVTVTLHNTGGDIITSRGFSETELHRYLVFTDPDGNAITVNDIDHAVSEETPPPRVIPINGTLQQVEAVEVVPAGWVLTYVIPDGSGFNAHYFYTLVQSGAYSVRAEIPMRTYSGIDYTVAGVDYARISSAEWEGTLKSNPAEFIMAGDGDGDLFWSPLAEPGAVSPYDVPDCDDTNPDVNPLAVEIPGNGIDDDCNPETYDAVVLGPWTLKLIADLHTVGSGSYPPSSKQPLSGLPVNVYDKKEASFCLDRFGVSWQTYKSIWKSCPVGDLGGARATDASGEVTFTLDPGNYLVIAEFDPDGVPDSGDEIYIGRSVNVPQSEGSTMVKHLQAIVKADGETVPAKYTMRGSDLMVIEPEFIEWDEQEELYPFIFESSDAWNVTSAVTPPEGFESDSKSLALDISGGTAAVQFLITDTGAIVWDDTSTEHKVKNKGGPNDAVLSRIGVKCAQKLAEGKGLNRFCK